MKSFLEQHWFGILLVAVIATRLPYLFLGYGADADSWLVANSARLLWETGNYHPSRLPGYPLHEILTSPMVALGGSVLSNLTTLLVSLAAIYFWSRIAHQHGRHPVLLVAALAFAPSVWQHSAETIDYMWSLCFILLAFFLLDRRLESIAGLLLGAAIGCRPSNVIILIPIVVYAFLERHSKQQMTGMLAACTVTTFILFSGLLLRFGFWGWLTSTQIQMNDVHPTSFVQRIIAFGYRSVYFVGPLTLAFAVWLLWKGRSVLKEHLHARRSILSASIVAVVMYLLQFFFLPLERAYLLPALPFFLLLVDAVTSRREFTVFTIILVLAGLINLDVIRSDKRREAGFNIHCGMVVEEFNNRRDLLASRDRIPRLLVPDSSIVMTSAGPTLWLDNPLLEPSPLEPALLDSTLPGIVHFEGHRKVLQGKGNPSTFFVMYLVRDELERARRAGLKPLCLASAVKYIEPAVGYTMREAGVEIIPDDE